MKNPFKFSNNDIKFKENEIKNLGEYRDLCLESDALLLADVSENFRKMCLVNYQSDPAKFLTTLKLAWQSVLKKISVKLELFADIDMVLMVEKSIRSGICHSINLYAKANKCI